MFGGRTDGEGDGGKKRRKRKASAVVDEEVVVKESDVIVNGDGETETMTSESIADKKAAEDETDLKAAEEDEMTKDSGAEFGGGTASMLPLCGLEDDEHMLSFLHSSHKGDLQRAKLSTIVNIDRGYGKICTAALFSFDIYDNYSNLRLS